VRLSRILFISVLAIPGGSALCRAQSADLKDVLLPRLKSQFELTKMSADGNDVVTAGSALTLRKDGLQMCSIQAVIPIDNSYKGGKLSAGRFLWGMAMGLAQPNLPISNVPMRTFVGGEKFWVTAVDVQKSYVIFKVYSDVYDGARYYAQIVFPYNKKSPPSADDLMKTVGEVVTVDAAPAEQATAQAPPQPAPQEAPAAVPEPAARHFAPPPPPSDAPPPPLPTVSLGQTMDQVIAILGQPKSMSKVGIKTIMTYPNLKVVFENGKVKDVQ
jgi:hypothetical protein